MDKTQFETICKKLDKIFAIIGVQNIKDQEDKIYSLKRLGFTSDEISPIVNIKNVRDTKGWKRK
ncbi:hypothetical protein KAT80_03280 [Candidatus Pacearchaeota archaeon]|nr:hypothetical protein [Candidatus Pacearchaeota archaeon]